MKYVLVLLALVGCTDTDKAGWSALGEPGDIECFSGGKSIFKGRSTGKIQTVDNSDGWEFKDEATGKFIRVSGACLIKN